MARPRTTSDAAILAAAARMIGHHGAGNLTLAMVAREAGLSAATLVQRFGSKRGLLLAVSATAVEQVATDFAKARSSAGSPLTALGDAVTGMAEAVGDRNALAHGLAFLQMDITDPEFRRLAAAHAHAVREEIRRLLVAAIDAGELASGVDTGRLSRSIQVTYNGSLIVWALTGDGDLAGALAADLADLLAPYRRTSEHRASEHRSSERRTPEPNAAISGTDPERRGSS